MIDKDKIVQAARADVDRRFPDTDLKGSCLYSTLALMRSLYRETGIKAQVQAGTVSWRAIAPEFDDGGITHFTFMWSPNELPSIISMAQGCLPEIHIWAAIIETEEIIDINSRYMEKFFTEACPGKVWSAPKPPDYLWCNAREAPDCVYEPIPDAIGYVYSVMKKLHQQGKL